MERSVPVRKPNTSSADLLTWSESAASDLPLANSTASASRRSLKPPGAISPVMFGAPMSVEEADNVNKRKPCSGSKLKEMNGSGIFVGQSENGETETGSAVSNPNNKTTVRMYQQTLTGMSQISFSTDGTVSPKKPVSLTEVAKQRELSGNLEGETELNSKGSNSTKKQISQAKTKELSGNDIFGPPPEQSARPLAARNMELRGNLDFALPQPRSVHTSVKVSNPAGGRSNITFSEEGPIKTSKKIHNQKFQELTGNGIFKDDAPRHPAVSTLEKSLSSAKLKEMSGNNIFSDGSAPVSRDYLGGVRKPPGGESSISLI